jgi:hypothetical protein
MQYLHIQITNVMKQLYLQSMRAAAQHSTLHTHFLAMKPGSYINPDNQQHQQQTVIQDVTKV